MYAYTSNFITVTVLLPYILLPLLPKEYFHLFPYYLRLLQYYWFPHSHIALIHIPCLPFCTSPPPFFVDVTESAQTNLQTGYINNWRLQAVAGSVKSLGILTWPCSPHHITDGQHPRSTVLWTSLPNIATAQ